MKVFILAQCLTGGGAERVAATLADGLIGRGHKVYLFFDDTKRITYHTAPDVNLVPYKPNKYHLPKKIRRLLTAGFISRHIRKERPDAVIGCKDTYAFIAKLAVLLSGLHIPVIFSDHNALERPADVPMPWNERFYKFYFSRYCDIYTVLTHADKKVAEEKRLKNAVVMHNPLCILPCKGLPAKSNTILAVGRLDAWYCKGLDILIKAWSQIANRYPDWKLQIVGSGSENSEKEVRLMIHDAGLESRISLCPFTQNIIDYYRDSSVFVLSSRYEAFGLVLTEAMSQGCACVACDFKGRQKEIVTDGVDGLICEPGNVEMLSTRVARLIDDDTLRHSIQQAAVKSVTRFSPVSYAERWEELLVAASEQKKKKFQLS